MAEKELNISFSIDEDLLAELDKVVRTNFENRSHAIRTFIRLGLKKEADKNAS